MEEIDIGTSAIDIGTLSVQPPIIWTHFVIEDGIVYAGGRRQRGPETRRSLALLPSYLTQVAKKPGSPIADRVPALLAFYRVFGFLAPVDRPLPAQGRRRRSIRSSESIAWALRHVSNVQTIMVLHQAMSRRDAGGRIRLDETLLDRFTERRFAAVRPVKLAKDERQPRRPWRSTLPNVDGLDMRRLVMVPGLREEDGMQTLPVARVAGESALAFGRRIVAALLTPNLARVRRIYDPVEGVSRFAFDCLIDVVYWQLANNLTAGDLRQCPCGQLFFAQDQRRRACPPLPGRQESRCGQRFRMQRKRRGLAAPQPTAFVKRKA